MAPPGDVSREEMDAKLQAAEARLDAKLSGIAADITIMRSRLDTMGTDVASTRAEVSKENRSTRTTIIVTAIVVVVALVAAVWQMQAGLLSAFQLGLTSRPLVSDTSNTSPSRPE